MTGSPKQQVVKGEHDPYPLVGPAVKKTTLPGKSYLSDLVDLMETVEMLCSIWPERNPITERRSDYTL